MASYRATDDLCGGKGGVDGQYLERMAREYSRELWTPKEVLYHCYRLAEPLHPTDMVPAIRCTMSPNLFKVLQEAAARTLAAMHPDAEYFGVGIVAPEAEPAVAEVPRAFVESMAGVDTSG